MIGETGLAAAARLLVVLVTGCETGFLAGCAGGASFLAMLGLVAGIGAEGALFCCCFLDAAEVGLDVAA